MKEWNKLYDVLRFPIKLLLIAFLFIEINSIVTSKGMNLFYNLQNNYLLIFTEVLSKIGQAVIYNFPLIVIVRLVSRRTKSGTPVLIGIVGYITFLVCTMIFQSPNTPLEASHEILGISYNASLIPNAASGLRFPLQTGLIGAFIVGFITRFSYVKSRRRNPYSLLAFLDKDTVGYIYNICLCALAGILLSVFWPQFLKLISDLNAQIASDISNPKHLFIYGFMDRVSSLLGLSDLVRTPFWFGSYGGSFSTFSGETIVGDVNIFSKLLELNRSIVFQGRFITPYYVINMFVVPAMIFMLYFLNNKKNEKIKYIIPVILYIVAQIIFGNPLPLEMLLVFLAPLLYFMYLGLTCSLFALFEILNIYLGFEYSGNPMFAMPGSFLDYIIFIRNVDVYQNILFIFLIGLIYASLAALIVYIYVNYLAYDLLGSGKKETMAAKIVDSIGGYENIELVYSNIYKLSIVVKDQEKISIEKLQNLKVSKIAETNDGVILYIGIASTILRKQIIKLIKKYARI